MSDKGGYCFSCQKWKHASKLTTCRMCESPVLYCKSDKCSSNQNNCQTCGRENPGNWMCDRYGKEHLLKRGQKTHVCVRCDEFEYCLKHLVICSCGIGGTHYFCDDDGPCVEETTCKGEECRKRLCCNGELIEGIPETVFCDEHIPRDKFKKRLIEAAATKK